MEKIDKEFGLHLFNLSKSPTLKELKQKYRELIKIYHPDKHPEKIEWSTTMMQQLNQAYEILLAHLHRIFNQQQKQKGSTEKPIITTQSVEHAIAQGDDALRDAVIIGWLKRTPKDEFARGFRTKVTAAYRFLSSCDNLEAVSSKALFYKDLFFAFLESTEQKKPRPLPAVQNPTKLLHYLSSANGYLDSGIRNFYRFAENRSVSILANIPLSFLDDAIGIFTILKKEINDPLTLSLISAKIDLAGLFEIRIKDPELTYLWPDF
jgi:curved DNA-binding protein CbpA